MAHNAMPIKGVTSPAGKLIYLSHANNVIDTIKYHNFNLSYNLLHTNILTQTRTIYENRNKIKSSFIYNKKNMFPFN